MAFAIASLCSMVAWLLAEQVGFLHVDGAEGLVDGEHDGERDGRLGRSQHDHEDREHLPGDLSRALHVDRKSTRLNSSHLVISYAVFCLKKKIHNRCD